MGDLEGVGDLEGLRDLEDVDDLEVVGDLEDGRQSGTSASLHSEPPSYYCSCSHSR